MGKHFLDGDSDATETVTEDALAPFLNGQSFDDIWRAYENDGYVIFQNVMPPEDVIAVRRALEPHLTKLGRNDFEGFNSNRVYSLLAKAPEVFSKMATHPLALAFAERELGYSCLLSAMLAINLHPNETVQDWHWDDQQIFVPRPHKAFGVSTFWAIDDMTETNGATEIIPGSHKWADDQGISFAQGDGAMVKNSVDEDPAPREDAVKVVMPSGSLMVAKGTLFHRGGANKSDTPRLIVTPQYCPGWARQLENMTLAVPKEIAASLPRRTRELMGYNIHAAFMGYVDGVHPDKVLGIDHR